MIGRARPGPFGRFEPLSQPGSRPSLSAIAAM